MACSHHFLPDSFHSFTLPQAIMPVIFTLPVSQALPPFPVLTSAFLPACIQSVNCHTGS